MFVILKKFGAETKGFTSDWQCFLSFLRIHIAEVCELPVAQLDHRLTQLAQVVAYSQRVLSMALQNYYSDVIVVGKTYMKPRFESAKYDDLIMNHWKRILKTSKDIRAVQMKMKDDGLIKRRHHMYEIDWDYYQTQLRLLSSSATKNLADLTRADVTKLICAVEGNIGCRKTEILDPTVIFQSYAKWSKELDASGLPVSTDFVLGDEREGLVLDRDRALEEFRQENIIVQRGRFKDAAQRDMKYSEDGVDEILRTNAIIKRPCLLFSAEDTVKMVYLIRRYFKLTLATRPAGPDARRVLGDLVSARDVKTYVLEPYFPKIVAHAKTNNFNLGSHWFRSAAVNFLAVVYEQKIRNARGPGRSIHRQDVMMALLSHAGSVQSAMSYANIDARMPVLTVKELSTPVEHRLMLMQKSIDLLLKDNVELRARLDSIKPREECSDFIEFKRADGTIASVPKRNDTARHASAAERDAAIQRAIDELQKAGVAQTATNIQRCGFGFETYKDWKEKLPLNYTASARKCKKEKEQLAAKDGAAPPPVAALARPVPVVAPAAPVVPPPAPRELRERGSHVSNLPLQLPYGDKVILTKPNSTANAKRTQLKRGRETFSGPENAGMTLDSDADCEGTITTKVVKTDKNRDLAVRVCEEKR